jgi:ATP-dependent RNA helicase RhlE
LPKEAESYVHRIGRTARAGTDGIALSLCDAGEKSYLRKIELEIGCALNVDQNHPFHSQSIANKKKDERKSGAKNFSNGRGRGSKGRSTAHSEGKNKSFSFSRNRSAGKSLNRGKNNNNQRSG